MTVTEKREGTKTKKKLINPNEYIQIKLTNRKETNICYVLLYQIQQ